MAEAFHIRDEFTGSPGPLNAHMPEVQEGAASGLAWSAPYDMSIVRGDDDVEEEVTVGWIMLSSGQALGTDGLY